MNSHEDKEHYILNDHESKDISLRHNTWGYVVDQVLEGEFDIDDLELIEEEEIDQETQRENNQNYRA